MKQHMETTSTGCKQPKPTCSISSLFDKVIHRFLFVFSLLLKGIISDSNIFLQHESEDIYKKSLLPKFKLIPILRLQVRHDYVH